MSDKIDMEEIIRNALMVEVNEAQEAGQIKYMGRILVLATIPHRRTKENCFKRTNGNFGLSITALSEIGLPYGSIPRLFMSWMTTEAVRQKSRVLDLGNSMTAFMEDLGLHRTGGKRGDIARLKTQTRRLFNSVISYRYVTQEMEQVKNYTVSDAYEMWWEKSPDQQLLWGSTVTLSQPFFEEITRNPVPLDMQALRALKNSPMELDTYIWLTHRMSYLRRDTVIPWGMLQEQFGADYDAGRQGSRNFKKKFLVSLKKVLAVYSKARVTEEKVGLLIKPSPPHVSKKMIIFPAKTALSEKPDKELSPMPILKPETYEKAKSVAPGYDIENLEQQWKAWLVEKSKRPRFPDNAFIGFCRNKSNVVQLFAKTQPKISKPKFISPKNMTTEISKADQIQANQERGRITEIIDAINIMPKDEKERVLNWAFEECIKGNKTLERIYRKEGISTTILQSRFDWFDQNF